jgi:Fe-S-cluster containining protein
MLTKPRLQALSRIYERYEAFSKDLKMACQRGCSRCCTQNVTMTTLEGRRIMQHPKVTNQKALLPASGANLHSVRYSPTITTNGFALLCFRGEDPPEEQNVYTGTACRFLSDNECMIYDSRPFGCRCFFSTQACTAQDCAVIDPFLLTVNTVFLQFIEHMDTGGFFGNLNDVLGFLTSEDRHESTNVPIQGRGLAQNKIIPGFLIPQEHQERMEPILMDLKRIASPYS